MSKLALGTVQFGLDYGINNDRGKIPKDEAFGIIGLAAENGIDMLDTAPSYGTSQEVIGAYQKEHKRQFKIISKLSTQSIADVKGSIDSTLRKLGVDDLYGMIFHDFDDFKANPGYLEQLREASAAGKVTKVGFSLYTTESLDHLLENNVYFDLVQVPYSILDQRFGRYFGKLKERGVEIHVRSVFLQGLLFKDPEKVDPFFTDIKSSLKNVHAVGLETGASMVELCLGFALHNGYIDKIVAGVDSENNLREIISASKDTGKLDGAYERLLRLKIDDEKYLLPYNWRTERS